MIVAYIFKELIKKPGKKLQGRKKQKKAAGKPQPVIAPRIIPNRIAVMNVGKPLPAAGAEAIRPRLSDAGWLTDILTASRPGGKKMEFPFEKIPPVTVALDDSTQTTLKIVGGTLAAGMLLSAIVKRKKS